MSPGYDRSDQQDFRRAIGLNCMFCHNAYPPGFTGDEAVFPADLPEGIDCQRCHGPGRSHAELAGSGKASVEQIRRAIVNPVRLSRELQLDVCMQCHLESTSAPLPNALPKYGRGPFSYRPGQPLGESFVYFDYAPGTGHDDKFEIAHQAYRLRKSRCFQQSAMTCTTCHNPHDAKSSEAACLKCHATPHQPSGCIECHMPKRRTQDAVHVVMTDHYIQRRKPAGDLLAPLSEPSAAYRGEVVPYYPAQIEELYLALAQVRDASNLAAGIPRLRNAIETRKPAEADFYFELGKAYLKSGNASEAISWCDEALRRRPQFPAAQKELGAALIAAGDLARAAGVFEKLPEDPVALANLGNVYVRQGADRAAAERAYRKAIAIQPDLVGAHGSLATLLAQARNYTEAAAHFESAIAADPSDAGSHHGYGLLLVVKGSYDKAIHEFRRAVSLAPQLAQPHNDLADVLAAQGKVREAIAEFNAAIQADPNLFEAHLALGAILARTGDRAGAKAHFEKAAQSPDPEVRAAALKALR